MTEEELRIQYEASECDEEYAEFIMDNADCLIPNGDVLLELMESGFMFEEFVQHKLSLTNVD